MKHYLLVLAIFISSFIRAQDSITVEKSLLWEISGNGLERSSYIFGTIHLIPEKDYLFTKRMSSILDECEILALEIDMNIPILTQIDLVKKMLFPDGKTLQNYLSEEEYSKYSSYILDSLKIKKSKLNQINKLKPIFAGSIILNELLPKTKTYEIEFSKIAKKSGMEVVGLETIEYQMSIMNSISIEKQIDMMLKGGLTENPLDEYMELVEIYKNQDIQRMQDISKEDEFMIEYEDELLFKRNKNWIPVIEKLINKNCTFVAVGAMHLSGEFGVLNLLKIKGYTLKPVKI